MENGRLVELMSEMLDELKGTNRRVDHLTERVDDMAGDIRVMKSDIGIMKGDISEMRGDIHVMKQDIGGLKTGQAKTNVALHELRTSALQLAEGVNRIPELDQRLSRVEAVVFKKS